MHGGKITGEKIKLREKKLSDARADYRWQCDPELAKLDAAPMLIMPFALYLLDYTSVAHEYDHYRYPLAVETLDGKHIGNCTAYDIDEKRGEAQIGIMIGNRDYWDKGYGVDVITTLVNYVFQNSSLSRLYLKTLDWNIRAQKCFAKCGFVPCGSLKKDGYSFMLMELMRDRWEKRQSSLHESR